MGITSNKLSYDEHRLEKIRNVLLKMPESVRGKNVGRLIGLVEDATLLLRSDPGEDELADLSNRNNPAFAVAKSEFRKLTKQAKKFASVTSSKPWEWTDSVDGLRLIISHSKAIDAEIDIEALATAINVLADFPFAPKRSRGRPHHSEALTKAIRAVCFYRQEEGLALQYHFDAVKPLGVNNRKSTNQELQPTNDTGALACEIAELWGLGINVEVRTELRNYHDLLKTQSRAPRIEDLELVF